MTAMVDAARAALCKQPHTFCWWAYDRAWVELQRENHARWSQKLPLLTSVEPRHYEFLKEAK